MTSRLGVTLCALLALGLALSACRPAEAKIYIDVIQSPRKLPVAVLELNGPYGAVISRIVRSDLQLSGLFAPMSEDAFMQRPEQEFRRESWAGTGVEFVVRGGVTAGAELEVMVELHDAVEGREIFRKQYRAGRALVRPLAHAIANDIFQKATGRDGIFRSKLLYVTHEENLYRLNLADWDGQRPVPLQVTGGALMAPRWAPDADTVYYAAERGRAWGVYRTSLSTMREEQILKAQGTNITGDVLPDGSGLLLSMSRNGSPDLHLLDLKSGEIKRLTWDFGIEVSPAVAPDGASIAFVSDRGGTPQIYTMGLVGYNVKRITYTGQYNTSPTWSPEGDLIAYSGRHQGKNQIFTIWADGTGARMLTSAGNNEEPSFSPDGRFIAFTSDRDGHKAVYVMRVNGEDQRRLTDKGVHAFTPRWSPR
jgi:TolB protein